MTGRHKSFKKLAVLCSLLTAVLSVSSVSAAAGEVEKVKDCSVSVHFELENNPIADEQFKIYRIAEVDEYNEMEYTADFSESGISLNNNTDEEWAAFAQTMETYIVEQENNDNEIKPTEEETTDTSGVASFENLEEGVYLLTGEAVEVDGEKVTPIASLITLPYSSDEDGSSEVRNATVSTKAEVQPENTPIKTPETTSVSVEKLWDDEGFEDKRPDDVTMVLYRDNEEYDKVKLNDENDWKYTWEDLDSSSDWQVIEADVPEMYEMKESQDGSTFKVTNIYDENGNGDYPENPDEPEDPDEPASPENPDGNPSEPSTPSNPSTPSTPRTPSTKTSSTPSPTLPQTGQLEWPIPIMAAGGLILLTAGCTIRRKLRDDDEK
jgi:hypothetical protein